MQRTSEQRAQHAAEQARYAATAKGRSKRADWDASEMGLARRRRYESGLSAGLRTGRYQRKHNLQLVQRLLKEIK